MQLADLQKLADFAEQLRTELMTVVNQQTARCPPSGKVFLATVGAV